MLNAVIDKINRTDKNIVIACIIGFLAFFSIPFVCLYIQVNVFNIEIQDFYMGIFGFMGLEMVAVFFVGYAIWLFLSVFKSCESLK